MVNRKRGERVNLVCDWCGVTFERLKCDISDSTKHFFHNAECKHKWQVKDLTGMRFGKLLVLRQSDSGCRDGEMYWLCRCDCGNEKDIRGTHLTAGDTLSCGCYMIELVIERFTNQKGINHPLFGKHLSDEHKRKLSEIGKMREDLKGENHPMWKGGINRIKTDNEISRNSRKYLLSLWSNEVKVRDNWTCQICHDRNSKLNSHHIKSFKYFPNDRFDIDNGITLCVECHKWIHGLKPINQQ